MPQSTSASPPVRRPAQDTARDRPAVVAGNWASSMISPVGQARIEMAWLRAWVSTPMTNGRVWATIAMVVKAPVLEVDGVTVTSAAGAVREEVTSGRICDGPRPVRVGQSPDEVTEVGRMASAAPTGADNSTGGHRALRANCFESHTLVGTTDIHPDQPVPDQPPSDSQMASVPPLLARAVVK